MVAARADADRLAEALRESRHALGRMVALYAEARLTGTYAGPLRRNAERVPMDLADVDRETAAALAAHEALKP